MDDATPVGPATKAATAYAKVNLFLHVLGRRSDGYHDLSSLMAFADIGDGIHLALHETAIQADYPDIGLDITGPFAPHLIHGTGERDNIIIQAARAFTNASSGWSKLSIHITLEKNIPLGAGLGGGSSDAATVLRLLQKISQDHPTITPVDPEILEPIAAKLGADVPFCLSGKAAYITNIGSVDPQPLAFPDMAMLLVNPGTVLSTAKVFGAADFVQDHDEKTPLYPSKWENRDTFIDFLYRQRNDLEAKAIELCPPIGDLLSMLRYAPDCRLARMSGSGSTCFGLFDDLEAAKDAAQYIHKLHEGANTWMHVSRLRFMS